MYENNITTDVIVKRVSFFYLLSLHDGSMRSSDNIGFT